MASPWPSLPLPSLPWTSWAGKFALISALAFPVFAQDSNASPQQGPITTLHSATHLVVLDVVVTDKSGKPVSNLSRDDFTVSEDKNAQMIASFERPDQHKYVIATTSLDPKSGEHRDRNASPALTILVIDCMNTEFLDIAYAREMVTKYLRTHGPRLPQPTALMMVTDTQLELVHDYTEDASLLQEALKRHEAEFPFRQGEGRAVVGSLDRLSDTLSCLEKIAAASKNFAGRKNVIWIGSGFPAIDLVLANGFSQGVLGSGGDLERAINAVSTTANEMWDARLAVYTIDPRGLQVTSPASINAQGLQATTPASIDAPSGTRTFESIASQTGARIFFNRNDLDVAISSSVDDGADYYTLSYYPTNGNWDGKFRNIKVTLANPNLKARTRKGYYATPDAPDTDTKIDSELAGAVKNPLSYRALGMSVSYKILGGTPRTARYTIAADRHDLGWHPAPDGDRRCSIMVVAMSVSRKSRVVKNDVKALEGTVKAGKFEKQMDKPMLFTFTGELPPDAVRLRVVVRDDRTGNIGTADLNVGEPVASNARANTRVR
jgi:VWFA-related protein